VRRRALLAAACGPVLISPRASAHEAFGRVTPARSASPWLLLDDSGRRRVLRQRLQGRVTAVQLMFTGCNSTCPLQGALFGDAARRLGGRLPAAQLLSISVDPLGDDPAALRAWLGRFGRPPGWQAAAPRPDDLWPLVGFLQGRVLGRDNHSTQVYLFDRQARLVFRSAELPPAAHVVALLEDAARQG
jgi:protein SCO1